MRRTPCDGSGSLIALDELLKLEEIGQFPDDPVKIEDTQIYRFYYEQQVKRELKRIHRDEVNKREF